MRLNMRLATTTTGSSTFTFDLFTLMVGGFDEDSAEAFLLGLVLLIGTAFPSNKDA